MKIPEGYISPIEAAQQLGVSKATVHRWIDRGVLPAKRFGLGRLMVARADIERMIAGEDVRPKEQQ